MGITQGFICMACGYLDISKIHNEDCLPFHNTKDFYCAARVPSDPSYQDETCKQCNS